MAVSSSLVADMGQEDQSSGDLDETSCVDICCIHLAQSQAWGCQLWGSLTQVPAALIVSCVTQSPSAGRSASEVASSSPYVRDCAVDA